MKSPPLLGTTSSKYARRSAGTSSGSRSRMLVSCARCSTQVNRKPNEVKDRNYCSRTCHYAHTSGAARPNRKKGQDQPCEVCGTVFYAYTKPEQRQAGKRRRFCSMKCKGVASRETFTCETCGEESYGYQNLNKRWCSRECHLQTRRFGEDRNCQECGSAFYVQRNRPAHQGKFCSNACHDAYQGRNKTEHVCTICGNAYRWSPSRMASGKYNPKYCSLACRGACPDFRAHILRMNTMQQLGRTTRAEAAGYAILDGLGVEYERQAPFNGKFTPDATVSNFRLVVQFDGDYWHDRAGTSTEDRIRRRVRLDHSQDAYIRACGWDVLRLWESDLRDDPVGCAEQISQCLRQPA